MYWGSSIRVKLTFAEFGSEILQGAPPPVHAEEPIETTFVDAVVLTVCVPEQGAPKVVQLHVYVNVSPALGGLAMEGPPAGVKSTVALTVIVPWPAPWLVRAR